MHTLVWVSVCLVCLAAGGCGRAREKAPAGEAPRLSVVSPPPQEMLPTFVRPRAPLGSPYVLPGLSVVGGGAVSYSAHKVATAVAFPVTRGVVPIGAARDVAVLRKETVEILDTSVLPATTSRDELLTMISKASGRSREEIVSGFFGAAGEHHGAVRVRIAEQELVLNRVSSARPTVGGGSSPWLSGEDIVANVKPKFALPAANEANFIAEAVVPRGVMFLEGHAAPLNGQPGGFVQIFAATRDAKILSTSTFEDLAGRAGGRALVSRAAGVELVVAQKWLRSLKWLGVGIAAAGVATLGYNYYEAKKLNNEAGASQRLRRTIDRPSLRAAP